MADVDINSIYGRWRVVQIDQRGRENINELWMVVWWEGFPLVCSSCNVILGFDVEKKAVAAAMALRLKGKQVRLFRPGALQYGGVAVWGRCSGGVAITHEPTPEPVDVTRVEDSYRQFIPAIGPRIFLTILEPLEPYVFRSHHQKLPSPRKA